MCIFFFSVLFIEANLIAVSVHTMRSREYFVQDVIDSSKLSPVKMIISICLLINVYSKFNLAVVFFMPPLSLKRCNSQSNRRECVHKCLDVSHKNKLCA